MSRDALLVLSDGATFEGEAVGHVPESGVATGEVVFNTALSGYQEILTDPSYAGQMITFTYPHIGNYGVNPDDVESRRPFCSGVLVRDLARRPSNWRATGSLDEFLHRHRVPGIAGIDTRRLTRHLWEAGALPGAFGTDEPAVRAAASVAVTTDGIDLVADVTTEQPYTAGDPDAAFHVVAYDYGIKRNILRLLADRGARVTVVPAQFPAREVLRMKPDGVFLSNGPGDPEPCDYAIEAIGEILDATKVPVFGICLGHQLMGLASGAKTMKMKFGHHGANHPVKDLDTGRVVITSQNHGFAVDPCSISRNLRPTHVSLFDGSLQGLARTDRPAFCFQGHPEASPGPHDIGYLFDRFAKMMSDAKA
jgi:carbamoyl-phosphate synthase small subunit